MLGFDLPEFLSSLQRAAPGPGDLLLTVGSPPRVFADGAGSPVVVPGLDRLTPFQTEAVALHLLSAAPPSAAARLRDEGSSYFAYSVPAVSRYRATVFSQRGTLAVALRTIPPRAPELSGLGLPAAVAEACRERYGMVLVNGPVRSGRTTTLAAMVNELNRTRACHVVTVEEPIEFLHRHGKATVNQREVGIDTPTLAQGLRDARWQGAQVLVASEVHREDEARVLLESAETGTLVLTTVRGFDTASVILRLVSLFPKDERAEIRIRLSQVLRWSFTQQLLPLRRGWGPVTEVWRATRPTIDYLAESQVESATLADVLRDGEHDGQRSFDRVLEGLVRDGEMTVEAAVSAAVLPRQLELRLLDVRGGGG